jgi:hypothetical protein
VTDRITKPVRFYGVNFATATNQVDPQTHDRVSAPRVSVTGKTLTADLRAFAVSWNNQQFNQGSPKPDGSMPGNTRAVTGSYDSTTGAYSLQWTSQIQGGPFDGFTGLWHLSGRFVPSGSTSGSRPSGSSVPPSGTHASAPSSPASTSSTVSRNGSTTRRTPGAAAATVSAAPPTGGTAALSGSASPDVTAPSGPSTTGPGGANVAAVGHKSSSTPRWPWELVAALVAAAVAATLLRRGRGGVSS